MSERILERDPSDPKKKEDINPVLKLALELGPLMVFFFANARGEWLAERFPLLWAISVGRSSSPPPCSWSPWRSRCRYPGLLVRSLPIMPLVSGIVVFVFGALTLYLQDEIFIKMKPTIVNSLFGAVLLGGLFFGKSLLGYVFDSAFKLDAEGWRKLTLRWGWFFFFLAVLNEVVWRGFSTDFWVAFKVWGTMPITIAFTMAQMPLIMRHALDEEKQPAK
jgi:intracellular septation protein